jgi:hypothetical protein
MANPTADQYLAFLGTLNSKPIKGRVKENVNPEIEWAEKKLGWKNTKTPEPWCAAHLCYGADHFPGFLESIGGVTLAAAAWEGRAPTHGAWHPRHAAKDALPGAFMEMDFNGHGGADHTEAFVRRLDSEHFIARGGNVGGDNAADNVRLFANVYGWFMPKFAPTDHTKYSGTLYWYRASKPIQHSLYVRQMQEWLNDWGYKVEVDDYYGKHTAAAVKAFQTDHNPLEVDGKVGGKTWAQLKKKPPTE